MESVSTDQPLTTHSSLNSTAEPDCIDDSKEWKAIHDGVLIIGSTTLILVGTVANTITYKVLKQKAFRRNVMSGALQYLSILDTIILWTVVLEIFINSALEFDIMSVSWESCGLFPFYLLSITSLNSWLLVLISATRVIHLLYPTSMHTICSKFNYYGAMFLIHVGVVAAHGGVQLTIYLGFNKEKPIHTVCYFLVQEAESKNPILMLTTLCTNFLIPCILLFVCNTMMVIKLRSMEYRQKTLHDSSRQLSSAKNTNAPHTGGKNSSFNALYTGEDMNRDNTKLRLSLETKPGYDIKTPLTDATASNPFGDANNSYTKWFSADADRKPSVAERNNTGVRTTPAKSRSGIFSIISSAINEPIDMDDPTEGVSFSPTRDGDTGEKEQGGRPSVVAKGRKTVSAYNRDSRRLHSLTILLISASFIYLVLNIPFFAFHIFFAGPVNEMVKGCYMKNLIPYSTFLLQYCNHCINFFVYCAAGSQFRQEFFKLYRRICKRN